MKNRTTTTVVFLALVASPSAGLADALSDVNAAINAMRNGAYDQAIPLLDNAISSGNLSKDQSATAYFDRGVAYLNKGQSDNAIADFTQSIALRPKDSG